MKLFVTGGAGFIGSNFIGHILNKYPNYEAVNFDKLTYAGNLENLKDLEEDPRYKFVRGDICDKAAVLSSVEGADAIVNFAAETHVDRSIMNDNDFLKTDILGVKNLLEAARELKIKKIVHISTDEVYGDMDDGGFAKETDPLRPSSPYSASKAGGDLLCLAYARTYGAPVIITRCTNNYGPNQYPEKFIPLFITNLLEGKKVPVYGDGGQIRDWLHVQDHCEAIDLVLHQGEAGEVYNIGANPHFAPPSPNASEGRCEASRGKQNHEITNLELTKEIVSACGKDKDSIDYVKDRPGHDRRYAVDTAKIRALGWTPKIDFAEGLQKTVEWYKNNEAWWKKIKTGEYLEYYKKQYAQL